MDIGFWELLLRVLLIYLLLLVSMRIMGKREIGQLSNLDFVVAIVVAELATLPLTDLCVSKLSPYAKLKAD